MMRFLILAGLAAALALSSPAAARVIVSSKIDTEGNLLGNVIKLVLQRAGIEVEDRIGLGSTPIVRRAIKSGEIDIYPEYTANAAFFYNMPDAEVWKSAVRGYETAKQLDYQAERIVWLTPAPANNTWAIAVREDMASSNGLRTMSDFGRFIARGGTVKLACSSEFVHSAGALPAFQAAYGFTLSGSALLVFSGGDTAATIKAAAEGTDGTNAAMVYGTDGAIAGVGLVVMEDDKGVQPVYAPTPIIREEALQRHPQIPDLLKPVFASFDLETLQELNARIAIGGESAATVAESYLANRGLIK